MSSKIQIKICGINSNQSAEACNGADFIGFVFYQKSPRFVTAFEAKEISKYLQTNLKKVGLFVNSEINLIKHISEFVNLDIIQLHGTETIKNIQQIKIATKKPIIKAIPISNKTDIMNSKKIEEVCDMILFDKKSENHGGTGSSFDWKLLKGFKSKKQWMLAGGLNIDNVKEAILATNAPIIDISSGVEKRRGVKCEKKIKKLINYLKKNER